MLTAAGTDGSVTALTEVAQLSRSGSYPDGRVERRQAMEPTSTTAIPIAASTPPIAFHTVGPMPL